MDSALFGVIIGAIIPILIGIINHIVDFFKSNKEHKRYIQKARYDKMLVCAEMTIAILVPLLSKYKIMKNVIDSIITGNEENPDELEELELLFMEFQKFEKWVASVENEHQFSINTIQTYFDISSIIDNGDSSQVSNSLLNIGKINSKYEENNRIIDKLESIGRHDEADQYYDKINGFNKLYINELKDLSKVFSNQIQIIDNSIVEIRDKIQVYN